jgi:large subunit ribosomal protein L18
MKTLKRRRKENKTDYLKRLKLLKSNSSRIVFRKTNKYIISQYVTSKEAQDKIELGINSKDLLKYGWPEESKTSIKSISASYLTGFLMGKNILNKKLKTPILDIGMIQNMHKTKVYGFIKGIIDSGVKIKCNEETFPSQERIEGKNMKKDFSKTFSEIKLKIEKIK